MRNKTVMLGLLSVLVVGFFIHDAIAVLDVTKMKEQNDATCVTISYPNSLQSYHDIKNPKNMTVYGYRLSLSSPYGHLVEGNAQLARTINSNSSTVQIVPFYQRDIHSLQQGAGMDNINWLPIPLLIPGNTTVRVITYDATVPELVQPNGTHAYYSSSNIWLSYNGTHIVYHTGMLTITACASYELIYQ